MNRFQPKALAIAIAALGAGVMVMPSAHALSPARTAAAIAAGNVIYATGATAPTKSVWRSIRQRQCAVNAADTFDVYKQGAVGANPFDPGDSGFGNSFSYSCRLSATAPALAGQDVVFMFGVSGGSFSSFIGQSTDAARQNNFVSAALTGCTAQGAVTTSDGDAIFTGCAVEKVRSMGGFSDVEAPLFAAIATGIPGITLADINITPASAGQTFGVLVSQPLYRAMQGAQGLPAGCQDDGNLTAQVVVGLNDRSAACQPSISKQEYTSIVTTGKNSVAKTQGAGFIGGAAILGQQLTVCRRPATSGTQASSNQFFLENPCASGSLTFGSRNVATQGALGNIQYIQANGSADVRTCLNNATSIVTDVSSPQTSNSVYRIGVMSGENQPDPGDGFSFIKIDGVAINEDAQNRQTLIDGKYNFGYELVLHTNKNAAVTPAFATALLTDIGVDMGNPTQSNLRGLFQLKTAAFPQTTFPTQVAKGTRNGNSCSPFAY